MTLSARTLSLRRLTCPHSLASPIPNLKPSHLAQSLPVLQSRGYPAFPPDPDPQNKRVPDDLRASDELKGSLYDKVTDHITAQPGRTLAGMAALGILGVVAWKKAR